MKGCKHLFYSSHLHNSFNKHCLMFKQDILKWDAGTYSAFNCQNCLFLAWKSSASKKTKCRSQLSVFIFLLTKLLGEIPENLQIKENFYNHKFPCSAALMKIFCTCSLNPSLYHLNILNAQPVASTSSSCFFTAQKDLLQYRKTTGFYLLNIPVLTQQNIWKSWIENEGSKGLNLVQESMVNAICQERWEETQVSQSRLSLSL